MFFETVERDGEKAAAAGDGAERVRYLTPPVLWAHSTFIALGVVKRCMWVLACACLYQKHAITA
jgi:hypothetical protein